MTDDQELDLASLNDADLVKQMHSDLYDGMADEIAEGTNLLLGRGWSPSGCSTRRSSKACASWASTSATASCSCRRCSSPPTR